MSAFAIVTFDLSGATSDDYESMEEQLANHGLYPYVIGDSKRKVELPTTVYASEFEKQPSADDLRDWLLESARNANVSVGRYFVFSSPSGWGWRAR